jgi:hypothetical protein
MMADGIEGESLLFVTKAVRLGRFVQPSIEPSSAACLRKTGKKSAIILCFVTRAACTPLFIAATTRPVRDVTGNREPDALIAQH